MTDPFRPEELIETERYILRRADNHYAEKKYSAYATDPEVTRYLSWRPHQSVSETQEFLKEVQEEWNSGRGFAYVILDRANPEYLIGMIHMHTTPTSAGFGYVLRKEEWGKGCASEILSTLIEVALTHPSIYRAFAFCYPENKASMRVMEKAGMKKEGVLRRYFIHPNISDEPTDCVMFAKTR